MALVRITWRNCVWHWLGSLGGTVCGIGYDHLEELYVALVRITWRNCMWHWLGSLGGTVCGIG